MPQTRSASPYKGGYPRLRGILLGDGVQCAHCKRARATELDHDPPLAMHTPPRRLRLLPPDPELLGLRPLPGRPDRRPAAGARGRSSPARAEEPERDGIRGRRPALARALAAPSCARSAGRRDLAAPDEPAPPPGGRQPGPRVRAPAAEERSGKPLRWWQRLVAARLLEIDAAGRLVWEAVVFSTARQVGKSWLLRELCLWRIHQGERFGEPQDVLHTGKDLAVCQGGPAPGAHLGQGRARRATRCARSTARRRSSCLADGSRWMLRAKEAVYGYAVSMAAVDEAWKVRAAPIDEGLTPTMVEREQAQLLLISHRPPPRHQADARAPHGGPGRARERRAATC